MNRVINELGRVNPVLLIITLAVVFGVACHWCLSTWSTAAEAAEDDSDRELRQMIDTYRGTR